MLARHARSVQMCVVFLLPHQTRFPPQRHTITDHACVCLWALLGCCSPKRLPVQVAAPTHASCALLVFSFCNCYFAAFADVCVCVCGEEQGHKKVSTWHIFSICSTWLLHHLHKRQWILNCVTLISWVPLNLYRLRHTAPYFRRWSTVLNL